MSLESDNCKSLSVNEHIKYNSRLLRGTIAAEMADLSTGAISEENGQLTKFHGLYLQDDRDLRQERRKQGREKAFTFMLRVRLPGGRCASRQYLMLDRLADERGNGTLRLTTRQTFQLHGILKGNVKPVIQGMHTVLRLTARGYNTFMHADLVVRHFIVFFKARKAIVGAKNGVFACLDKTLFA